MTKPIINSGISITKKKATVKKKEKIGDSSKICRKARVFL